MNSYVNKGGRAFFTHFSYAWLYDIAPSNQLPWLSTTNTRNVDGTHWDSNIQVQVNTAFPRGQTFSEWLGARRRSAALSGTNPPQITVLEARENMHTPINLPIDDRPGVAHDLSENPCGRAARDLRRAVGLPGRAAVRTRPLERLPRHRGRQYQRPDFPAECTNPEFTAQEKVLAYMMFDMTAMVNGAEC